jgi:hypothetical protein
VSHGEALRALSSSNLLLLAGPAAVGEAADIERGTIAAKAFEYLGARRPVLYIGHLDADVARLLGPLGGVAFVRAGDVQAAVRGAGDLLASGRTPESGQLEAFTRRALTRRLAALFDNVARA